MSHSAEDLAEALLATGGPVVALSGAGISVDSDIPAFRGEGGLWDRYDPSEYATISAFQQRPGEVWNMLRELDEVLESAEPNPAHRALAELEERGLLTAVITQNVDGLHQAAGSREVIEVHGSRLTLSCLDCGQSKSREQVVGNLDSGQVPRCDACGGLLKPDVVFFGEMLPEQQMRRAQELSRESTLFVVVGTSAEVYPVAELPDLAARTGAEIWEVNPAPALRNARAVTGTAEGVLPEVVEHIRRLT